MKRDPFHRREVLQAVGRFGATALLPGVLPACATAPPRPPVPSTARQPELIARENRQPGTRDWLLGPTMIDPATKWRSPAVEGYASRPSVKAGDRISFHVSTNPPSPFTIDLFRMGHYGGAGARRVARLGPFEGRTQPDPPVGRERVRECRWEPCASLTVPPDWPSGLYLGKISAARGPFESYLVFIVRDDRAADFVFQCSDTTWHAYNRWPSQFSLYDSDDDKWYWGPNVQVSFERPYGKYCQPQMIDSDLSIGSGEWFLWEFPLAYWLESQGYDVTYVSNLDTHANPRALLRAKGLLSVGHDEYYSLEMFHGLRQAIADGLSVAFLSGNTCCGLIEVLPGSDGTPDRIIRRVDRFGPRDAVGDQVFRMQKLPRTGPDESALIGARSTGVIMGGAPWTCVRPDHWLFAGTGMKKGDGIPGLVGWEWHGDPAPIPGLEVVATGATHCRAGDGVYTATVYPGPKGNFVFNAATCWWADGLAAPPGYKHPKAHGAEPQGPDPRVQRITANLLARM